MRNANGLRRSPLSELTDSEVEFVKSEIRAINADEVAFNFVDALRTAYSDEADIINIAGDVFESPDESTHPRDLMSVRAVLAHEYYGHRAYRGTSLAQGDWRDEFRASYTAAKNAPNLSVEDRCCLISDALERAKEAGVKIETNNFMRSVLYGY